MKIGIMTFWSSQDNYGQILQMYALYTHLTECGNDVFIINYNASNDDSVRRGFVAKLKRAICNPQLLYQYFANKRKTKNITHGKYVVHPCGFDDFKERYFKWSPEYKSYNEIAQYPPKADVYICGSDIVWGGTKKFNPYFLEFVNKGKKVAYAPSFGRREISKTDGEQIKGLLSSFSAISVREESGAKFCKSIGFSKTKWMPDPTTLLSKEDYLQIAKKPKAENYIFMYLLGHSTEIPLEDIFALAKEQNLSIQYRAIQGRYDDMEKVYPTIEEWIGYINYSEYVITNSFHGCIISIILNKKFILLPLTGNDSAKNERMYSLLERLHLNSRIWSKDNGVNNIQNNIDYNLVNENLQCWVAEAKEFLATNTSDL